jgi:hypothetical protein
MNIRQRPVLTDLEGNPVVAPLLYEEPFSYDPQFAPVGQPWRYVFPRRPSTFDPNDRPDFTVPMPGYDYTPWKWVPPAGPVAPPDQ